MAIESYGSMTDRLVDSLTENMTDGELVVVGVIFLAVAVLNFWPIIWAYVKKHPERHYILLYWGGFCLALLLVSDVIPKWVGYTGTYFWLVAMCWAYRGRWAFRYMREDSIFLRSARPRPTTPTTPASEVA